MSIESDKERQERIEKAGIGSPEYFGEVFRLGTSNQIRDEWRITDPVRVRRLVADKLGFTPEEIENLEQGKLGIPPREQLVEWGKKLNLAADINDDLILAAGYLPDIPDLSLLSPALQQARLQMAIMEVIKPNKNAGLGRRMRMHFGVCKALLKSLFTRVPFDES